MKGEMHMATRKKPDNGLAVELMIAKNRIAELETWLASANGRIKVLEQLLDKNKADLIQTYEALSYCLTKIPRPFKNFGTT
jgi:predicted  nucleic acid-binding Zn-ribbon protein